VGIGELLRNAAAGIRETFERFGKTVLRPVFRATGVVGAERRLGRAGNAGRAGRQVADNGSRGDRHNRGKMQMENQTALHCFQANGCWWRVLGF
jgi:hypothetical protein